MLAETCMGLEHQGLDAVEPNVLLACFQDAGQFTPAIQSRYEFLATQAASTGALGHGMPVTPLPAAAAPTWPPTTPCGGSGT